MTKKTSLSRRNFVGGTLVGLGIGAIAEPNGFAADCVAECKLLYPDKRTLAAYEFFTKGCGKGTASIQAPAHVQVAEFVPEALIAYSAPKEGIVPGGRVKLWCPNGATKPQLDDPDKPGFMQIETAVPHQAKLARVSFSEMYNQPRNWRFVDVTLPAGLPPGETLLFRWKKVKVDSVAARFDGDRWLFRIAVDHDADGFSELIPAPPEIPKLPGPAVRLLARISSTAVKGEPVRLNVCAFDRFDNPASGYAGTLKVSCDQKGVRLPKNVQISSHGAVQCDVFFNEPGFYWVTVRSADGLETESNPVEVFAEDPGMRLYWGDIHVHTEMSADARAAVQSASTYAGSYNIGRYQYALDFQANTDHQGVLQGNYGSKDWNEMRRITNAADDPGKFATLVAAELSGPKGDQNVYYAEANAPFLDHNPGDQQGREKAWKKLRGTECFLVPHHFCQSMRPWDWSVFNPELQPVAEIFSIHGRAEYHDNDPAYARHGGGNATLDGRTWTEQLDTGKRLGAIASSDNHGARPGTCGLTGVWAPALTREAIYQGVKTRHCYATTTDRVILHFAADGAEMGQEISCKKPPAFKIRAAAPGPIRTLEIIRDGETVYRQEPDGRVVDVEWTEEVLENAYYYVRLTLAPEKNVESSMKNKVQFVWSSPVWISKAAQ